MPDRQLKIVIVLIVGLNSVLTACLLVGQIHGLSGLSRRMDTIGQAAQSTDLSRRKENASKAFAMGQDIIKAGHSEKARLFFLNAVNQDPSNSTYLSTYAESVLNAADASSDEIDRASNVLQAAVYLVPPDQIDSALTLIDRLSDAYQRSLATRIPGKSARIPSDDDITADYKKLDRLKSLDPEQIWRDSAQINLQVGDLRSLASDLLNYDAADSDIVKLKPQIQAELARWESIQRNKAQCDYLDGCLNKLDNGSLDPASDASVSVLQAADNALPQFWGEDFTRFPKSLVDKIIAYPLRISDWSRKVAAAQSQPVLDEIRKGCEEAERSAAQCAKHEDACQLLQRQAKKASVLRANIKSPDVLASADAVIEKLVNTLGDQRKAQYNAYQKWALDKCAVAFNRWHDFWRNNSENAVAVYDGDQLYQIDPALLSRDVSQLYSDVVNKLFPNMTPSVEVDMWRKTEQQKWELDRF